MNTLLVIAAVMFIAGALGGLIAFFISDPQNGNKLAWWQQMVVGIGAAFIVPLFLNMISGDLIDKIRGVNGQNPDFSKLFVLAGFCLVAAISQRAFIHSMSRKLLQAVEEAKEQAAEVKEVIDSQIEDETTDEMLSGSLQMSGNLQTKKIPAIADLNDDERSILRIMVNSPYSMRSISGMAKDSGLERAKVEATIASLMNKRLLAQGRSTSGQPRWYPTSLGRKLSANI